MLELMAEILSVTAPFFALIACGYGSRRAGVMVEGSTRALNDFVLFFALPALLVRTLAGIPVADLVDLDFIKLWTAVGLTMYLAVLLIAVLFFRETGGAATIEAAISTHGNVGYLGLTLVTGLLGAQAVAYVSMAIIIDMMLIIPLTIALIGVFVKRRGEGLAAVAGALRSAIFNPFVASISLGVLLSALEVTPPALVDSFLQTLGSAAVPTALFAIGAALHGRSISEDWKRMSALVAVKLLVHPLAIFLVGAVWLQLDPALVAAGVLLAALPTANNVFMLALRNDVHPQVVSGAIVASTVLAALTFNAFALYMRAG